MIRIRYAAGILLLIPLTACTGLGPSAQSASAPLQETLRFVEFSNISGSKIEVLSGETILLEVVSHNTTQRIAVAVPARVTLRQEGSQMRCGSAMLTTQSPEVTRMTCTPAQLTLPNL